MLIECLITFCILTNCCVFGGFVFWAHKYSCFNNQFIKPLIEAIQNLKSFFIANIIMEEVYIIVNKQPPTSGESNITPPSIPPDDKRYDRLYAVVAGGNSKKYFGKEYYHDRD